MHFYYDLDEEEGDDLDADSLTGYLSLTSGDGLIEEHDVFLDSWLAALIEGLAAVEDGQGGSVEIEEEIHPLVFEPAGEGFRLSYADDTITIPSTRDFRELLSATCRFFLLESQSRIGSDTNLALQSIRQFVGPALLGAKLKAPAS